MALECRFGEKSIQEFTSLFREGKLNLNPGFQRDSVWTLSDRRKLMESVMQNYPVPSVFLYKRKNERGRLVYDVIDGKQRLESILMFQGVGRFRGKRFAALARLNGEQAPAEWDWKSIERKRQQHLVDGYDIQTVEVAGDLAEVIDLFVRINSTGKRLTGAEKRHARFYRTDFLKQAGRVAGQYREYFVRHRILSPGQISRMKHVELVSELLASIDSNGLINKKSELDKIIGGKSLDGRSLPRCVAECRRTFNRLQRMFPRLRETRFANSVDFYTLFMLVWDLEKRGLILNDPRRNRQAERLLIWLTLGVDEVRDQLRKGKGTRRDQALFRDYLLTVQGDTDSQATRRRRAEILVKIVGQLFAQKDTKRGFTTEQRRLIWHSDEAKKCPSCGKPLTWENFTIDHIKPYSRGGRTSPTNAELMCRSCNAKKGARPSRRRSPRKRLGRAVA
jgi:5-methylcytosine-specific restriction endonuclease McrA